MPAPVHTCCTLTTAPPCAPDCTRACTRARSLAPSSGLLRSSSTLPSTDEGPPWLWSDTCGHQSGAMSKLKRSEKLLERPAKYPSYTQNYTDTSFKRPSHCQLPASRNQNGVRPGQAPVLGRPYGDTALTSFRKEENSDDVPLKLNVLLWGSGSLAPFQVST